MTRRQLFTMIAVAFAPKKAAASIRELGRPCLTIGRIRPSLERILDEHRAYQYFRRTFDCSLAEFKPRTKVGCTFVARKPARLQ